MKLYRYFIVFMCVFLFAILFSVSSFAEESTTANTETVEAVFQWEVTDKSAKTAKITSVNTDVTGELIVPSDIDGYTVSEIANYAFRDCVSITSVVYNANIDVLPSGLFYGCTSLESVAFNTQIKNVNSYVFYKCSALKEFIAPSTLESIGIYAFNGCTSLENVYLNEGLISIGHNSFGGCTSLKSIIIPSTVTSVATRVFYQCLSLEKIEVAEGNTHYVADEAGVLYPSDYSSMLQYPYASSVEAYKIADGVTSIANGDFTGIVNLKSLTIPDSVTSVAMNTFKQSSIENLVIGSGLTSVGNYAFSESALKTVVINAVTDSWGDRVFASCAGLETVVFNSESSVIPEAMFNNCSSLKTATGLESIKKVGSSAFWLCSQLNSIDVGADVTDIYSSAFYGCSSLNAFPFGDKIQRIDMFAFSLCSNVSGALILPDTLTTLGSNAFSGCTGITSLTISSSLTSLPSSAFSGCTGIKDVVIPSNIKSIGNSCFNNIKLNSLVISEGVESIDGSAFYDCGISDIQLPSTIKNIGNNAFQNHYDTEIMIPAGVESIGQMAFNGRVSYTVYVYSTDCVYDENTCPYNRNAYYSTITVYGYQGSTTENYIANCPTLSGDYHNHIYYDMCDDAGLHVPFEECADVTTCKYCLATVSGHSDDDVDKLCDDCGASAELPVYTPDCSLHFENGILTVSGTAITVGDYEELLASYSEETKTIVFNDGFVSVGADVFSGFSSVEFILVPSTLTSLGENCFADSVNLKSIVCFADELTVSDSAFSQNVAFNWFIDSQAAVVGTDSYPSLNVIYHSYENGTLDFDGSLKTNLYDLFDVTTMFSLVCPGIMTLHFDRFEAVDFSVFAYNTEDYSAVDKTVFENVEFTLHAFIDGEYTQISFYQLYEMSSQGYDGIFYLTTITDEESVVHDDTQISIADQFNQVIQRILSAIVRLFNKIFAFFSKLR